MSDIVDDLRGDAVLLWSSDPEANTYEDWQDMCRHAADEIELLRSEVEDLRSLMSETIKKLNGEE